MIEYQKGIFWSHGPGCPVLLRVNAYGLLELLHFGEPARTADSDRSRFRTVYDQGGYHL